MRTIGAARQLGDLLRAAGFGALDPDHPLARVAAGLEVEVARLDAGLADRLVELELARREGDVLVPLARLTSWDGLVIAHDADGPADLHAETVLGVNNTTRTLATLTPRDRVGRTLDVATGSAGPALLAARHSDAVVASDLSERAIWFASINAELNATPIDCRTGSLFEPVVGEEPFDLVTANLPFVVSPDTAYTFRDGGFGGDGVCRAAVASAADHLAEGGVALMLCNWIVPEGATWDHPLRAWVQGLGCDCLVVHHVTDEPDAYARRWNEFLLAKDPVAYAPTIQRWEHAFADWGVQGIGAGAIVLRRRAGADPWFHPLEMKVVPAGDGGSQVTRAIRNLDALAGVDDAALADRALALVSPHGLDQTMAYDEGWSMRPARMVLNDTAGPVGTIDPVAIHVVLRLDGVTPLGALCDAVAEDTGLPADQVVSATLASCRGLLEAGCLALLPT